MRCAAFIPARGGSKRVPGKNLAYVGRGYARDMSPWSGTLLARAVHAASACDSVTISTDDLGIRLAAESWPIVRVHDRPAHLASDHAQIESSIAHWYDGLAEKPDVIVMLQATSPFRTADHVRAALDLLASTGADSVVGVKDVSMDHAFAGREMLVGDRRMFCPTRSLADRPRSQDVPEVLRETGALYAFTRQHWEKTGNRMGGYMVPLRMDEIASFDIDTPLDLEVARAIAEATGR